MRIPANTGISLCVLLAGCGLHTPDLQPLWQTRDDVKISVNRIVNEVKCELIQGVIRTIDEDKALAAQNNTPRKLAWLEDWSAKITLSLTVEENSAFSPGLTINHNFASAVQHFSNGTSVTVPQVFTVGLGGAVSSDATRIDKLDFFFVFKDFLNSSDPNTNLATPCQHFGKFLESDLKLGDWIEESVFANYTDSIAAPRNFTLPMTVISHQVTFLVKAAGNITPGFKLIDFSLNQGNSPFLQALRNKTDDVLITLGPTAAAEAAPSKQPQPVLAQPSQAVVLSHLASEIGLAVAQSLRTGP